MPQRSSTTAFAKSTRPEIGGVVARETLYARLDATPARTVAWISAPPGFGKTTLAASYLDSRNYQWAWYQVDDDDDDGESFFHYLSHAVRHIRADDAGPLPVFGPEHQADIAAFSRRFFRALFKGTAGPVAIALDNLHEFSAESPLRRVLEAGLPEVPRQCCVIVTSRAPPPGGLSRLQPSGQMVCIAAEDLRLTTTELGEMARLRGSSLPLEILGQVHERTEGWAAALVLMIEHHKLAESLAQLPIDTTPRVVFDYLAGEIFERFDEATQRLLLQIACMPRVTLEVAVGLTGEAAAGRILFNLAHNDYFVRELVGPDGRIFVLHPLAARIPHASSGTRGAVGGRCRCDSARGAPAARLRAARRCDGPVHRMRRLGRCGRACSRARRVAAGSGPARDARRLARNAASTHARRQPVAAVCARRCAGASRARVRRGAASRRRTKRTTVATIATAWRVAVSASSTCSCASSTT